MLRLILVTFGAMIALGMAIAPVHASPPENGIDRQGSDYKTLDLSPPVGLLSLEFECSDACTSDTQCKAWTLVNAGVQGPTAKCWLKNAVPSPSACSFCTSGVSGPFETLIDRPGGDYNNFDLASASPDLCLSACNGDRQCSAWTYVDPGVQGPKARCWLKTTVPVAKVSDCCTSGITQTPPVVR